MWPGHHERCGRPRPAHLPTLSDALNPRRPRRIRHHLDNLQNQQSTTYRYKESRNEATVTCLWVLTPIAAAAAALSVGVAIATDHWLMTEERIPNPNYNGTGESDFLSTQTQSGLWRLCYTEPGLARENCARIRIMPPAPRGPTNDATSAIPYAASRAAVPLLSAGGALLAACVCCAAGHCSRGRRLCTFAAGVLFIISGLLMLTGVVMYISLFKAEVGYKLRRLSLLQEPRMSYRYGYSFALYVLGFAAVQLAATSAISLFLHRWKKEWYLTHTTVPANTIHKHIMNTHKIERERTPSLSSPSTVLEHRKRSTYPPQSTRFPFDRSGSIDPDFPPRIAQCSVHRASGLFMDAGSTSLKDLSKISVYGFPPAPQPTLATNVDDSAVRYKDPPASANTLSGLRSASIFESQPTISSEKTSQNEGENIVWRRALPGGGWVQGAMETFEQPQPSCTNTGTLGRRQTPAHISPSRRRQLLVDWRKASRGDSSSEEQQVVAEWRPPVTKADKGTDTLRRTTPV